MGGSKIKGTGKVIWGCQNVDLLKTSPRVNDRKTPGKTGSRSESGENKAEQ